MNQVKRILSGIVIVIITLGVIRFDSPYYYLFLAAIGTTMAWEWERMVSLRTTGFAVCLAGVASFTPLLFHFLPIHAIVVALMAYIINYVYLTSKEEDRPKLLAFGVLYITVPLLSLSFLMSYFNEVGFYVILWLFLTVWASDTGGLVFGSILKGPKLAPKISPKKTWSGFFGGVILAVTTAWVYSFIFKDLPAIIVGRGNDYNLTILLTLTAFTSVISQVGDLFESHIKRRLWIKDSSDLIPGHGGVFDRLDGLLFASTFVTIIVVIRHLVVG